jgi:hypothetical protein
MSYRLIRELFPGPIDIVGDIHGEIDALRDLLRHLGYDRGGVHPQGRRLVFIGDLTDRGPDSPAVIELVADLVSRGLAQCVLGNHELNLMRKARKEGNGWYFDDNQDHRKKKFLNSMPVDAKKRPSIEAFLSSLPLALERADLRVVHAAWHAGSIADIRSSRLSALELYDLHHDRALRLGEDTGLAHRAEAEERSIGDGFTDPDRPIPLLPGVAALDALYQDANPVRIVTSGLERVAERVFFASGKWRMVDRFSWWDEYRDVTPVIIGHYWRWPITGARETYSRGEPDLFKEHAVHHWFGEKDNVFCVDFAVGARYKERADGPKAGFECRLAAVRWPEQGLVFDDGRTFELAGRSMEPVGSME